MKDCNICGKECMRQTKVIKGEFNLYAKEKKETLDKGLSKTKERVFKKIARVVAGN